MEKDPKEYSLNVRYNIEGEAFETEEDESSSGSSGGDGFSDSSSNNQQEEKELSPDEEALEEIEQEVDTLMEKLLKGIQISHLAGVTEEKAIELLESGQIDPPNEEIIAEGFAPDRGELTDLPPMGGDPNKIT